MRAFEFLQENASAGATASGAVATVAFPQGKKGKQVGFFGQYVNAGEDTPAEDVVVLKRDGSSKKKSKS